MSDTKMLTREEIEKIKRRERSSGLSLATVGEVKELCAMALTLMAEVERMRPLQEAAQCLHRRIVELEAEVERLRAEVNRVHNAWSDEYATETAKLNGWLSDCLDKRNELQSEVERLRPVVEAAIAYCDQLCSFNTLTHPEVHRRRKELAEVVGAYFRKLYGRDDDSRALEEANNA